MERYPSEFATQRENLVNWITNGGVLLTYDRMFKGCEAEAVVVIGHCSGDGVRGRRSVTTRAVSDLCLVISHLKIQQMEIKQYFDIKIF